MTRETPTRRWADIVYWVLLTIVSAGVMGSHTHLGFKFPIPWPDEGSFLWQAISFQENNTLFATELNPERPVFWMPPGYMWLSGLIFKVTGFSLAMTRVLSSVYVFGAVMALGVIIRRFPSRIAYVFFVGAFLQAPVVKLAANTGRMETLVLFLAVLGVVLLSMRRIWPGVSMLLLAPLVHPIGGVCFIGGAAYVLALVWKKWGDLRPRRYDFLWLALPLIGWGAYAIIVSRYWSYFSHDMLHQLTWKKAQFLMEGGRPRALREPGVWAAAAVLVPTFFVAVRYLRRLVPLFVLAVPLLAQTLLTVGWLYELYPLFVYLLLCVVVLECVVAGLEKVERLRRPLVRYAAIGVLTIVGAPLLLRVVTGYGWVVRSVLSTAVIRNLDEPAYVTEQDLQIVSKYLESVGSEDDPVVVQFVPEGDALLFAHLRTPYRKFLQQTFYEGIADVYIRHESVWATQSMRDNIALRLAMGAGLPVTREHWIRLRLRDGTEGWYAHRRTPEDDARMKIIRDIAAESKR